MRNSYGQTIIEPSDSAKTRIRRVAFRKRQHRFIFVCILGIAILFTAIFLIVATRSSNQSENTPTPSDDQTAQAEPTEGQTKEPNEPSPKEDASALTEIPTEEISATANISESGAKIVYLTFDDGPSPHTARLLDILKKYNVKATFFVTGAGDDVLITREYNEGHSVGLHTFTHDYAYVYSSIDNFFQDLYRVQQRVQNATGFTSTLIRFPGGSSNVVSTYYDGGTRIMSRLSEAVTARGFTYFDWNVSSGDAGAPLPPETIYENVVNNLKPDYSVVLQHDIKDYSVDAVERIIDYGLKNGYTFRRLEPDSYTAHHGINN